MQFRGCAYTFRIKERPTLYLHRVGQDSRKGSLQLVLAAGLFEKILL
jgi:hypothetical protein